MGFEFQFSELRYLHIVGRSQVHGDRKQSALHKMIYLNAGEASVTVDDRTEVCHAGELMLIGRNQVFSLQPVGENPADCYVVYFSHFLIPSDIADVIDYGQGVYPVAQSPIPELFARFDWHVNNVGDARTEIKMLFRCVLTEILVYFAGIAEKRAAIPGMLNSNMEPILNFISHNLDRPLQIRDICAEFHYSRSHLCKAFTQTTGVPIMQYIRTARADYAEKLLRSGLPATEVARQLGYSDYSAFYRMYRKHTSTAPSDTKENGSVISE